MNAIVQLQRHITGGFSRQRLLRFPRNLPRRLQELLSGKDSQVLADPPPPDDSLLIHEKKGPFCYHTLTTWIIGLPFCSSVHNTIRFGDFQGHVAEQRIRQLERVRKRLLRKGIVAANPQNLDV